MSIKIEITEKEILETPNNFELGEKIRNTYFDLKDKNKIFFEDIKDRCVICGKESPYLRSTDISERIGYVEGGGQACFQPNICGRF